MAADDYHLERLDFAALQAFIDGGVAKFQEELKNIRLSDTKSPSLFELSTRTPVMRLGFLEQDESTGMQALSGRMKNAAGAVDKVLNKHVTAFGELHLKLDDVITTMRKAQQHNLTEVDAQKFLTALGGYEAALGGGNSNASQTPPTSKN
ncbi:type VII secretion system-associated protein [Streptomyces sp. NRRL S-340]|uniref:type VII secretion system-associated protein n=1 Tax=Streptomyces sp. NRRL S-340 TaxID=1463901 RepID=UPI00056C3FD3|nr:type VII secretion system-associated protein [Streptomyces sp. NRRL S-340]